MTVLTTKNLTLEIAGRHLCQSLDLAIRPGEVWAVLGPNGSGKSTLVKTLAHLQPPSEGGVFLNGGPISAIKRQQIATKIGVLFQEIQDPFPVTVYEQVLGGRYAYLSQWAGETEEDHQLAKHAISTMNLESLSSQLTHHLSGGERQRAAFATLLAQQVDIFLLDEPLNHLDLPYQIKLLDQIQHLSEQGRSVLMVLHDPNIALRWSSHCLLLYGDGRWQAGLSNEIITSENLTGLYHYPLQEVVSETRRFFFPGR